MQTYEVLEKALALIEDEKNWCKRALAQRSRAHGCADRIDCIPLQSCGSQGRRRFLPFLTPPPL